VSKASPPKSLPNSPHSAGLSVFNASSSSNLKLLSRLLKNSISFEYDFFSVVDRPERPIQLIKYDQTKKTIYIPVVFENGKVTDKYITYKFTGEYFEKIAKK
jgi:hypothetical protein